MSYRYVKEPPEGRIGLDLAYSQAMKKVYDKYTDNSDVGLLYAESLMNLQPWDMYEKITKAPKSWTPEITATLEHLGRKNPKHPEAQVGLYNSLNAQEKLTEVAEAKKEFDQARQYADKIISSSSPL